MPAEPTVWQIVAQSGGASAGGLAVLILAAWVAVRVAPLVKTFVEGLVDEIGAGRRETNAKLDSLRDHIHVQDARHDARLASLDTRVERLERHFGNKDAA